MISDTSAGFGIGIGMGSAMTLSYICRGMRTRFEKTIGAPLACAITYERLLKELNHEVGAL